ncbi:hypothetical protein BD310DRAFT_933785 [Dichomitus squalens]|uniref:DUF6534 domain-containing protein n=1 Tax=Dichomitus squalens TaxID=114155 RepID=A0A4Q9PME7_9APHY|nr:hypothetical protein BD310DRAFT_933785 [Dichomitus squalens]
MSSSPPSNMTQPSMDLLAGPQIIGFLLAWGLQGALTVQVYLYHLSFPEDSRAVKTLVYLVLIYEWVQTGLVTSAATDVYVYSFGSVASVLDYHNTWFSVPIMSAVISFVVQCYFCWRIWTFSRLKVVTGVALFLSFSQMVLGVAGGITLHIIKAGAVGDTINRPIVAAGLFTAVVADVIIAASMTVLLLRSRSGIKRSDDVILRLVRLGIETGAMTATVTLVYALLFVVYTDNLLFECPGLILPKLYSNTLLVSLNNRAYVRRPGGQGDVHTFSGRTLVRDGRADISPEHSSTSQCEPHLLTPRMQIGVAAETYVSRDVDLKMAASNKEDHMELNPIAKGGVVPNI